MIAPATLQSFLGNTHTVEILRRAIRQNRLPHAMIFSGPSGVGKRTLAILLAELLNCASPLEDDACGVCASCHKILLGTHPDIREIHPDGAFIKIEQIRALIGEIAYKPFEARYRVAILDGAEQMRQEAANSLLKTLEEPPSQSIIILVTTNPHALLGTIRSRSRLIQFGGIPTEQIEIYLQREQGMNPEEARLAALFSQGSLEAALSFNSGKFQETRSLALRFVTLLATHKSFVEASAIAAELAKDKEKFALWLDATEAILQDLYYALVEPARIGQVDILENLRALAQTTPRGTVVSASKALAELRADLLHNVQRQIALESLYLKVQGSRFNVQC
jgi:DNA polymerase-3 subunit delta'